MKIISDYISTLAINIQNILIYLYLFVKKVIYYRNKRSQIIIFKLHTEILLNVTETQNVIR